MRICMLKHSAQAVSALTAGAGHMPSSTASGLCRDVANYKLELIVAVRGSQKCHCIATHTFTPQESVLRLQSK